MSLFCRHNRFLADCPICSKDTVHDQGRRPGRKTGARAASARPRSAKPASQEFSGPHASVGRYEDEEGMRYEVRLERVPGGLRLAEWSGSRLRRRAPVLAVEDLAALIAGASDALPAGDAEALTRALATEPGAADGDAGISRGRTGDFKDELRAEPLDGGRLRVARWVLRPGSGWQLQDAPPMLPAARFAEALADAAGKGLLSGMRGSTRL